MSSEEKLRFGSYEVLQREDGSNIVLGKGGFGRIYKARHAILGRITALKVIKEESLHAGGSNDKEKISEFKSEARAVAMLNHPGIAHIHDCASENGVFYQATEYCEGGTLQEYCEKNGPVPWEVARPMVVKILRGLEYAHANGIVHRDIKPANIMLAKSGSLDDPKIIDFGLAKSLSGEVVDPAATLRGGADAGGHTPATASPEQLRGSADEHPDGRTDLFSLGVSIWWVLIGKNPFGEMKTGPLYADRLGPASYESRLPEDLPSEAREILVMLLEKDRNKRVPSATRLLELLDAKAPPHLAEVVEETAPGSPAPQPLPAPPEFDDGWSLGSLIRSVPHGKLYEVKRIFDSSPGVALNADSGMEPRLLAGMRLAASRGLDLGVCRFLDWRLNGTDDTFILSPPTGCNLLAVLRKVGSSRFRDALPFLVQLARSFDTSCGWLGCGIQVDPSEIHVRHVSGGSDPDSFASWDDIDISAATCLPLLEGGGEGASSTEATISTSTQGFPPLARFAALVYRVVSGSAVSHAAFYTDSGYVMASGFSEDGNALIADTLCNPEPDIRLGHFLQMLSGLESQPVGEITPLASPPSADEIASASLPLVIAARVASAKPPAAAGTASVDDEIAELQRQIERKKSEAAARQAAEEAAAKKAEEDRLRKLEEERLAREVQKAEEEARRAAEAAAAKAKAEFEEKIKRESREAAERAEKERKRELQAELEAKQALAAQAAAEAERIAKQQKEAEAARIADEKKRRDELAAAEKEKQRQDLLEQKRQLDKQREEEEQRKREEKIKLDEKRKEEKRLQEEEKRKKAAASQAAAKPQTAVREEVVATPQASGNKKKLYAIAAVLAFVAIASAVVIKSLPGDKPSPVVKPEVVVEQESDDKKEPINTVAKIDPPPAEDPPPPPPPAPTFAVNFTKPKDTGDGYPYSSYRLSGGDLDGEVKSSANGTLAVTDAKPGSTYTLTLFGDLAGKNDIPLATAKLKLPEEPRQDTPLAVKLPTSLPALEIRNPYEYADYAQVAVVPPVSETGSASLATLSAQAPMAIEVMHLTPAPGLDELPALEFPTKETPLRLPALSSGNWSIRYTGSLLEERQEKVTTSASVRLTQKDVPKPLSGKYRALLPMTRFPDGKANPQLKPSTGVPRKNTKGEWEVDYFHRMVYPDYGETFKALKHASNLGQRELPHYLAVLIELRLARDNAAASRVGLVRSSPALDLIYSKSDQIEISLPDGEERNDMKLVMFSSGGFYRNPQNELKRWVGMYEGKMSLPPGDAKQKAIHAFFEDSCLAALDFATGEKKLVGGFRELNSAMEVASWPVLNFPGNYEIELKRDGDNLMIHKVSELVTYEGLIHKDDKYLSPGDGSAIHSVIFDAELGVEPVRMEKLD